MLDRSSLVTRLLEERIVVVRGGALGNAFLDWCRGFGPVLSWSFGDVLDLRVQEAPRNYLFTSGPVPYHWDGAFAAVVPHLQIFQCLQAPPPDCGGETIFCDTTRLWRDLGPDEQAHWRTVTFRYETEKVAHYGGCIEAALVDRHPVTGETILRYAEPVNGLNPVHVFGDEAVQARLRPLLYDPRYVYTHRWESGDVVIADNHALLHGRNAFQHEAPRHLQRVHVKEVESC